MIALAAGQDKALPIITGHVRTPSTSSSLTDPQTAELIIAARLGVRVFGYPARAHLFG